MNKIFKEDGFYITPFGAPRKRGVYAVCVVKITNSYPAQLKSFRIKYIGSSHNMALRVKSPQHPYRKLYKQLSDKYLVCCFYMECDDFKDKEIELIKKYKPELNIQYNGN